MVEPTGFHRTITERALVEEKEFRVKKEGTGTPEPEVSLDTADVVIDGMTTFRAMTTFRVFPQTV